MLLENIKIALQAIYSNRMRSILTMLGIIIGISSVIAIVSIGDSMKGAMNAEYEKIGTGRAIIFPSYYLTELRATDYFYPDDIDKMYARFGDDIQYLCPNGGFTSDVVKNRKTVSLSLSSVASGYEKLQNVELLYGRWINQRDINRKSMCTVLDEKAANEIFDKVNAVGETVRVKNNLGEMVDLLVVGVYKEEKSALYSLLAGPDRYVYGLIPYSIAFSDFEPAYSLEIFASDKIDMTEFEPKLLDFVSGIKNRNPEDYMLSTVQEEMGQVDTFLTGLSLAVGAIAAISLLVGGIGIMNIMLVSVTERTREIGIKKALGARTRDVLSQFLIESAVLSALGGIIGTAVGVGLVSLGGLFIPIPIIVNPGSIMLAVGFSTIIGIFFGYYPAKKAAKSDPIESLRYE